AVVAPAAVSPAAALPAALAAVRPAAAAPEAAKPADVVSARAQIASLAEAPDAEALWTGAVPAERARALLRRSHWETTKFFLGSRSVLLRSMVLQQKADTAGKPRAVRDLEGMWIDWRTKAYSGVVRTAGPQVADRATIRREAVKLWERYFPKDPEARASFLSYLDRVDQVVPLERPSYYRKKAFGVFYELPTMAPELLAAKIDAMLTADQLAKIDEHRATRQPLVMASFRAAVLASILEVNKDLPRGRRVIAMALLGSYSIGQSGPSSDIDYQLVTEDGGTAAIKPFAAALDRTWTENRLKDIEGFASTLPPSPEVVKDSFAEGYLIISPDAAAVAALSKDSFAPPAPTSWSRLRGRAAGAFWKGWVWSYFRLAGLLDLLVR
ncbi:MAG: hypothetical protein Q8T11_13295, partial [Elusimicrobiota bacterium]|nr:hypothetical protein [Elusimicrobiota bacterium]